MAFGSFCQICGNQLSWTTLVPHDGMYLIWRGNDEDDHIDRERLPVEFGATQEWLKKCVCLKSRNEEEVLQGDGRVDDGDVTFEDGREEDIETGLAEDLHEVRAGVHEACWRTCGDPMYKEIAHIKDSDDYHRIATQFHHQYFMFSDMDDDEIFMLEDPESDTEGGRRNKERIRALFAISVNDAREQKEAREAKSVSKRNQRATTQGPRLLDGFDGMTLYNWMGIPKTATQHDINRAMKRQMKRLHPNSAGGGDPEKYEQIRKAHYMLGHDEVRRTYDQCTFSNGDPATLEIARYWEAASRSLVG